MGNNTIYQPDASLPTIELGRYRHYKGNEYIVIGTGRHTESLESFVIYQSSTHPEQYWVRPYEMFMENVTVGGVEQRRFQKID